MNKKKSFQKNLALGLVITVHQPQHPLKDFSGLSFGSRLNIVNKLLVSLIYTIFKNTHVFRIHGSCRRLTTFNKLGKAVCKSIRTGYRTMKGGTEYGATNSGCWVLQNDGQGHSLRNDELGVLMLFRYTLTPRARRRKHDKM